MPAGVRQPHVRPLAADATPQLVGEGVWRVTAGAFPSNAYLCATGVPGEAFVIDPGLDPLAIDQAAQALGLKPRQVFCTHGHFDHIGGAHHFHQAYGAEVFLHPADLKTMKTGNFLLMVLKLEQRITLPPVTTIEPGHSIEAADRSPVVYHPVPGHTPGSCFVQWGEHLFTGDSLYARGVGLSDLPGEDHARLRQSLTAIWDRFPARTAVHPGHGASSTLGEIRTGNRALLDFLQLPETETQP